MKPETLRTWLPYVFAVVCGAYGITQGQMAWVAMAAGFIGGPSMARGVMADETE